MKSSLDGRAVLAHYGALNCREQTNHDGTTEIIHSCLLDRVYRHHSNGDGNPSAALNIDKGQYCCYSSGIGCSLERLVSSLEGGEVDLDLLGSFVVGATKSDEIFSEMVSQMFDRVTASQSEMPVYSSSIIIPWWHDKHPYWESRGISEEAIQTLRLGYDRSENRMVFPHFFREQLVGWQKRAASPRQYPKYQSSWQFPKSETLYNYDRAERGYPVCVVESPMSVARATSLGIPNVVATFGAKVSEYQIEMLSDFTPVYIWFDHDDAGFSGERKLCEGLYRKTDVRVVMPEEGMDMADYDLKGIERMVGTALPAFARMIQYPRRSKWEKSASR